jgi:hypothetical protein
MLEPMAVYSEVNICVGRAEADQVAMSEHFQAFETLHRPQEFEVQACHWISLVPKGFGYAVPRDEGYFIDSRQQRLEILKAVYAELARQGSFWLVQAGLELVEGLQYPDEDEEDALGDLTVASRVHDQPGTVVHRELLRHVGAPEAFSESHVWIDDLQALALLNPS